jgi:hypothetical protein
MWRPRLRDTRKFWTHSRGWQHEEQAFDYEFATYSTESALRGAIPGIAAISGLTDADVVAVPRYSDILPDPDPSE